MNSRMNASAAGGGGAALSTTGSGSAKRGRPPTSRRSGAPFSEQDTFFDQPKGCWSKTVDRPKNVPAPDWPPKVVSCSEPSRSLIAGRPELPLRGPRTAIRGTYPGCHGSTAPRLHGATAPLCGSTVAGWRRQRRRWRVGRCRRSRSSTTRARAGPSTAAWAPRRRALPRP